MTTRVDPKPTKNLPIKTILRLLHGNANAYIIFPTMQQEEAKSSAFWYEYDDHQEYSTAEMILAAGVIPIIMPAQAGLNPNWNNL